MLYVGLPAEIILSTATAEDPAHGVAEQKLHCIVKPRVQCGDLFMQTVRPEGPHFEYSPLPADETDGAWTLRSCSATPELEPVAGSAILTAIRFPAVMAIPKKRSQNSNYFVNSSENSSSLGHQAYDAGFLGFLPKDCQLLQDCLSLSLAPLQRSVASSNNVETKLNRGSE